jgi:putative membrane protein
MMWNWGYGWWWMGLSMILFWAVVIGLVVWAVRLSGRHADAGQADRAREVLEERYVRGDIDEEEFTRRLRHLDNSRP